MLDPTPASGTSPTQQPGWSDQLKAELAEIALRRPWGRAIRVIGFVHLAFFLAAQALHSLAIYDAWVMLSLWSVEVAAVVVSMRLAAGKGWLYEAPSVGLIFRVWVTFLILSFNTVMLNGMIGFDHENDFFKTVWCTLASFGFATMAWLFGLRFLIPAFQMYFTGLLIYKYPPWGYLIHGVSWCLALVFVGIDVDQRRARIAADRGLAAASSSPSGTSADRDF